MSSRATTDTTAAIALPPRPLWDDPLTALSAARRPTHPFKERFSGARVVFSAGRENDATGVYYYRARYYHPGLGRFVSEDPLRFASGDVNLYDYVGNRPTAFVDPLGLCRDPGGSGISPDPKIIQAARA
jgi:RHS repeat-associated protein